MMAPETHEARAAAILSSHKVGNTGHKARQVTAQVQGS